MTRKRTTMNLDIDLLRAAQEVAGTTQATETVHLALAELVRQERIRALLAWDQSELTPESLDVIRRSWTLSNPAGE